MYEPLHHKYRPQTFAQLVGQGAIAATLTNALTQNRIAPAYLFCGPRGTGKTSSARILAKSLNCLTVEAPTDTPCGECDVCTSVNKGSSLDIVEIDAASNTGVDNIRELIERSQFAPVQCRYKVYVIDECHMLSTAAFNALLKTLEEPPDRVVFVLATTDPQRVLPTIISRCQRFDFRRIPLPSMIKHLTHIAQTESIAIAPSATQLVAQISQGGLRDAESLLDQLSLQADEITVESVWDLVGAVPERDLLNLVRAIAADDGTALLERVRYLMDKGREPLIVLQSLVGFYRDLLIAKRAPGREDLVAITPPTWAEMTEFAQHLSAAQLLASQQKLQTAEVQVKNTTQPRLWLEITLTGLLPSALGAIAELTNSTPTATIPRPSVAGSPAIAAPPQISPPAASSPVAPPPSAPSQSMPAAAKPAALEQKQLEQKSPEPELPDLKPAASAPSASPAISPSETGAQSSAEQSSSVKPKIPNAERSNNREPSSSQPPPPVADVAFGSLADLWAQLLAVLQPKGTQMLMSQQGALLGFDGVGAKVGFRSAALQKMARERIPNLEAAFETVFQRPIKVSLEVISVEKTEEAANQQNAQPNPSLPSAPPVSRQPSLPTSPAQPTDRPTDRSPATSNNRPATSSNSSSPSGPPAVSPPPPPAAPDSSTRQNHPETNSQGHNSGNPRLDAPTDTVSFDQDQEKIERFANFFNGQIVNLNDDTTDSTEENNKSPKPKSTDPGPDVPF